MEQEHILYAWGEEHDASFCGGGYGNGWGGEREMHQVKDDTRKRDWIPVPASHDI
jgi:hypothetical protein